LQIKKKTVEEIAEELKQAKEQFKKTKEK